jgi:SnoaL-like domain
MDPVQELIALEALKRLKARYFYAVDTRDCEGWLALWAPDGWFQYEQAVSAGGQDGCPGEKFVGKDLRRIFDELLSVSPSSVHLGHSPLLEVLSETEARGIWPMSDIVMMPRQTIHGWGHYHETYRKIDGEWKFKTSYLKRLRLEFSQF